MPKYKKMILIGVLLVLVSVVGIYTYSKLFGCGGSFVAFPQILSFLELIVNIVSLAAFVLIPTGLILSYKGYVHWRIAKNKQPLSIFLELVGVTFVLGIIVSIYLAQFNSTRDIGLNAKTKSILNRSRAESELYYDNRSTYEGLCTNSQELIRIMKSAKVQLYSHGLLCSDIPPEIHCNSESAGYAISAQLHHLEDGGNYYCVDSTGFAGVTDTPTTGTECPK